MLTHQDSILSDNHFFCTGQCSGRQYSDSDTDSNTFRATSDQQSMISIGENEVTSDLEEMKLLENDELMAVWQGFFASNKMKA